MGHQQEHIDFEEFLQESVSRFRMTPPSRVWWSLYNNLHPSRRWPSPTSWLFFLTFLILTQTHHPQKVDPTWTSAFRVPQESSQQPSPSLSELTEVAPGTMIASASTMEQHSNQPSQVRRATESTNRTTDFPEMLSSDKTTLIYAIDTENGEKIMATPSLFVTGSATDDDGVPSTPISGPKTGDSKHNRMLVQVYAGSGIGMRSGTSEGNGAGTDPASTSRNTMNEINLEAGGAFLMRLNRSFRIKAGMQLNYSRFSLSPSKDLIPVSSLTPLDPDEPGLSRNNQSFQISLPIGTEYKIAGNDQFQWFAGATIQPSYLFRQSLPGLYTPGYPADLHLRKWNLNTSVETFLSYTLPDGSVIHAGPQVRYQVLPGFSNRLITDDRLYQLGLKLGFFRTL